MSGDRKTSRGSKKNDTFHTDIRPYGAPIPKPRNDYRNRGYSRNQGYRRGGSGRYSDRYNNYNNYRQRHDNRERRYYPPTRYNRTSRKKTDFELKEEGLSKEDYKLFKENKHCQQCLQYDGLLKADKPLDVSDRILQPDCEVRKYIRRKDHKKTCIHWGQRKLLLSEIEFLTLHSSKDVNVVIYAGAAPGAKNNFLADLFPHCTFILVDPAPFICKETDRVKLNPDSKKGFFTDALADFYKKKYGGSKILFISDIRTASWKQMSEKEVEEYVSSDMNAQMRWVQIMEPAASLLKFRLPYGSDVNKDLNGVPYLDGSIQLPVWGPLTTTESRLLVTDNKKIREYDHVKYEGQMFYFNTVTRTKIYPHCLTNDDEAKKIGLDGCFDCASEIFVCESYLKKFRETYSKEDLIKFIDDIDVNSAASKRRLINGNIKLGGKEATHEDKKRLDNLMSLDVAKDTDMVVSNNNIDNRVQPPPPVHCPPAKIMVEKKLEAGEGKPPKPPLSLSLLNEKKKEEILGHNVFKAMEEIEKLDNLPRDNLNKVFGILKRNEEKEDEEENISGKKRKEREDDDDEEIQPKKKKPKLGGKYEKVE